ncbi:MAG: rhodanese-like domain-containing protein [Chloroflexi bacterium]|nr:rhodanese-like domain-containing protein [Chloroflexota bacterium]
MRLLALLVLLLLLTLLYGCSETDRPRATALPATSVPATPVGIIVNTAYGAYKNLRPADLKAMLDKKDFLLVDVHTPPEGRLPKTDARIPYDQVEQQISKFPSDKYARIVLACRSGRMSSIASETLVRLGYRNVYNLDGGMIAWKAAGYEIIPEDK